jgi:hypothetical protein
MTDGFIFLSIVFAAVAILGISAIVDVFRLLRQQRKRERRNRDLW